MLMGLSIYGVAVISGSRYTPDSTVFMDALISLEELDH